MKQFSYGMPSVLICDPIGADRATTRETLRAVGFRNIELSVSPRDFGDALTTASFDLAICECQGVEDELFGVIRALRRGDLSHNPFIVLIATSWVESASLIRRAMESGVDDFLVRPVSTEILRQHIGALIEDRKAFTISRDYVGPVRQSDQSVPRSKPYFPPNSLRSKVKDPQRPEDINWQLARELRLARHRLETRMLWCDAFQICVHLKLTTEYAPASTKYARNFAEAMALARVVKMRVQKSKSELGIQYCQMVLSEIDTLSKNTINTDALALGRAAWSLYHYIDPTKSFEEYSSEVAAAAARVHDEKWSDGV